MDEGDIHCLMIGAAGVGKTANFLYPNIEYACASGMSFVTTDTKGDLFRNYAGIAKGGKPGRAVLAVPHGPGFDPV